MTTMQIDRAVVEQALETIEGLTRDRLFTAEWAGKHGVTIAALRAALAQEEQEPVAWMVYTQEGKSVCVTDNPADFTDEHRALPLYTHPPRRTWRGLTDEEIGDAYVKWDDTPGVSMADFARAIEQACKERNT